MMIYDHGVSGWGWAAMSLHMVLVWGLVIAVIVLIVRTLTKTSAQPHSGPEASASADRLLAERFARGEIDEDEYRQRLAIPRGADRPMASFEP